MNSRLLLLGLSWVVTTSAYAKPQQNAQLTGLVVTALSSEPGFEVLASEDVRKQIELEGERQTAGCEAGGSSCLAELAGALGARVVVYGNIGQLGESVVLTLNLFDSSDSSASGRAAVREANVDLVANGVPGAVHGLVVAYRNAHPAVEGEKTKVLVLDIEGKLAAPAPVATNGLLVPGIVTAGIGGALGLGGGALLAVSGVSHMQATDPTTVQKDVPALYDRRDVTGYLGTGVAALGVVGLGVGGALVLMGGE